MYPGHHIRACWRRVIKDADKVKARLKNVINEEEFCLNFDWKRIDNKEYQVDEELLKDSQSWRFGL